jgi:queuosine precursor transporter
MNRKDVVFALLGAFFLTNAVIAEIIGGKLVFVGPESLTFGGARLEASAGVFLWPVVFVTTDLVNEYFGRRGVRRLTFLTIGMIAYVFVALYLTGLVPASTNTGISDAHFDGVFRQSRWIIVGSLAAFAVSQLVDVGVFHLLRSKTGAGMLWARATGSTVVSQLIDSVIVLYIGLAVPNDWSFDVFLRVATPNYLIKLSIAIGMTPVIYLVHGLIERYLGRETARELAERAAAAKT